MIQNHWRVELKTSNVVLILTTALYFVVLRLSIPTLVFGSKYWQCIFHLPGSKRGNMIGRFDQPNLSVSTKLPPISVPKNDHIGSISVPPCSP